MSVRKFSILNKKDTEYLRQRGIDKYTIPLIDMALNVIENEGVREIKELWNRFALYFQGKEFQALRVVARRHGILFKAQRTYLISTGRSRALSGGLKTAARKLRKRSQETKSERKKAKDSK
jgi:hypothetical protein